MIERMFLGLHAELMLSRERVIDQNAVRIHQAFDEEEFEDNKETKMNKNIAVIGASGAIGNAFVEHYSNDQSVNAVYAFSRSKQSYENKKVQSFDLDIENQESIQKAAEELKENRLSHIIVATGILHSESFGPEKSIKDINHDRSAAWGNPLGQVGMDRWRHPKTA